MVSRKLASFKDFLHGELRPWRTLWKTVQDNGGIRKSFYTIYRMSDLKEIGRLVGVDELGNRYYENNRYFFGRNRWVVYNEKVGLNFDASMVPPEWDGWLHYRCDDPPNVKGRPRHEWMQKWTPNPTGTGIQYMPYPTVQSRIFPWEPKSKKGPKDRWPN